MGLPQVFIKVAGAHAEGKGGLLPLTFLFFVLLAVVCARTRAA
jgi:hypothetical protein